MAQFAYNNAKNASTSNTLFELNYGLYLWVSFKENVDPYFRSYLANKLTDKLKELIEICCQNLFYAQELQKRAYNKGVKSRNYTSSKKV